MTVGAEPALSPDQTRRLVAGLADPNPAVRLRAVRRVPPTADAGLLAAVAAALADPHSGGPLSPHARPVADEARRNVVPGQGRAAVPPLLAFARSPAGAGHRAAAAEVLGAIGPDDRSRAFLVALAAGGSHAERCAAVEALSRLGPEALPELFRVARDPDQHAVVRRLAVAGAAGPGTADTAGPFLLEALGFASGEHRSAAAAALGRVGHRAALPALRRRAEDEGEDQNVRMEAVRAYVARVDPAAGREYLRGLRGAGTAGVCRLAATGSAGLD